MQISICKNYNFPAKSKFLDDLIKLIKLPQSFPFSRPHKANNPLSSYSINTSLIPTITRNNRTLNFDTVNCVMSSLGRVQSGGEGGRRG